MAGKHYPFFNGSTLVQGCGDRHGFVSGLRNEVVDRKYKCSGNPNECASCGCLVNGGYRNKVRPKLYRVAFLSNPPTRLSHQRTPIRSQSLSVKESCHFVSNLIAAVCF